MPKKRGGRSTSGSSNTGGAGGAVLAFVLGAGVAAGAGYLYLHSAPQRPSAIAPAERVVSPAPAPKVPAPVTPPRAPRTAPFGTSEDVFEAGARQYSAHCATCHGTPEKDAARTPQAQQFWRKGRHALASDAPGEIYTSIAIGAPAKGMPGYARTLTDAEIWDLALLLKNADQDLPDPVLRLLDASAKP